MDLKLICVTVFLLGYTNAAQTKTMCKYLDCCNPAECTEKYEHNALECTTGEHIKVSGVHQYATYSGVCNNVKCKSCCDGTDAKANDTQKTTISALCNGNQTCSVTSANGYWMLFIFYDCIAVTSPKPAPTMLPSTGQTTQGKAITTSMNTASSKTVASTTTKMSTEMIKTENSKSYTRASSATESAIDVSTSSVANVAPAIATGIVVLGMALILGVCIYM